MASRRCSSPSRDEATFRFLLRFYPADFRVRYGEEMIEVYRHGLRRAIGIPARARFQMTAMADLCGSAVLVRLSRIPIRIGRRGLVVLPAAGSGSLAAGVCCAAICCTSHAALFGSVGLAGAVFGAWFEPLRPAALGLSALMLVASAGDSGNLIHRRRRFGERVHGMWPGRTALLASTGLWLLAFLAPAIAQLPHAH